MTDNENEKAVTPQKKVDRRQFFKGAAVGTAATLAVGGGVGLLASKYGSNVGIKRVGFSRARPIKSDVGLPRKVDVAIIGGGFLGTSTALALAERGISVALFEKGVIAGEASGRAGGLIESMWEAPDKLELIELSKQRWRQMNQITGEDTGLVQNGNICVFENEADVAGAEGWLSAVKGMPNGGAKMLSAREAQAAVPGCTRKIVGGMAAPGDMAAEPVLAAPAFALGARKLGAKIYQFCAVRGIERTAGRVSAVITEKGRVEASSVVIAGGVWSTMLGNDLDLDIPLLQCFAKSISLHPFDGPAAGTLNIVGDHKPWGWRRQPDGGYAAWEFEGWSPALPMWLSRLPSLLPAMRANIDALAPRFDLDTFMRWIPRRNPVPLDRPGPYEETRIYEPEPPYEGIDAGFARLQQAMPIFQQAAVRERWGGAMHLTMDNRPIISAVDTIPGLFANTGYFFGMTQGPAGGVLMADLITGVRPALDLKPYRLSRFSDGSEIQYDG